MKNLRFTIDGLRLKKFLIELVFNRQSSIVNRKFTVVLFSVLLVSILALGAQIQMPEVPRKESKFTLARVYYDFPMTRFGLGAVGSANGPPWSHDWPRSEEHFMKILSEVTKLDVNPSGHIISFQNDDCFKYPIAYLCEVGYIQLSKEEAQRMAEYLLRGGFLIVDDFRGPREANNFANQMHQVFPNRTIEELPRNHPIWTSFYDITDLEIPPPPIYSRYDKPQYFGISDDNGRLMMVIDYNNDISEYWEWSDDPLKPIDETNEAFKYGVNFVMYALTH
jgi:hypothetical protein